MNATITPAYVLPDLTGIVNGQPNDADDVRAIFTGSNQVNDILTLLANNIQTVYTTTATLTQNQNVDNLINSAGGAYTITLPAGTGSKKSYSFLKISNDYNQVTIQAAGSDKMNNPYSPVASPTDTSVKLIAPGDKIVIKWDATGGFWRVKAYPNDNVSFSARMSGNQSITVAGGVTIVQASVENWDTGGYYNNGTYRFQPTFPCECNITATGLFLSGTSSELVMSIYETAANERQFVQLTTATTLAGSCTALLRFNGTTDYVDFRVESRTVTRTFGGAENRLACFTGSLIRRL